MPAATGAAAANAGYAVSLTTAHDSRERRRVDAVDGPHEARVERAVGRRRVGRDLARERVDRDRRQRDRIGRRAGRAGRLGVRGGRGEEQSRTAARIGREAEVQARGYDPRAGRTRARRQNRDRRLRPVSTSPGAVPRRSTQRSRMASSISSSSSTGGAALTTPMPIASLMACLTILALVRVVREPLLGRVAALPDARLAVDVPRARLRDDVVLQARGRRARRGSRRPRRR